MSYFPASDNSKRYRRRDDSKCYRADSVRYRHDDSVCYRALVGMAPGAGDYSPSGVGDPTRD